MMNFYDFQKRKVVVRDPDGILREASWEEKQKMCQIFFPTPGRKIKEPKMFEEANLQVFYDKIWNA